jgi:hypothetical protein
MADAEVSPLAELARWLTDARERIRGQVHVREYKRASGNETVVAIDHRLSCDLDAHEGWHVQTRPTLLPRAHFSSWAIAHIKTAGRRRGRAIYCHDPLVQEVIAAVSYHIDDDPRMPILLTTLAFRTDAAGNPFLRYRTLAGALVLKHHLHALAGKIGRGGHLDIDLADRERLDLARALGFRSAPKMKGFRPGGLHLRQQAPH